MSIRSGKRKNIYLAGPLFSEAERSFNIKLKTMLEQYVDVYLPQEDGGLLVEMIAAGMPVGPAKQQVFQGDMMAIRNADVLVIILDGRSIDEGAAFELGCAYTLDKPCYGLKTDPRQLLKVGDNPMIVAALQTVFPNIDQLISWVRTFADESLHAPITATL